jgi:peptide deformylase
MGDFFSWIHDWQELVGAFLGSSLAIIFSGLGFLLARYLEVQDAQREALRKVEINNSYSLQSVFTIRKKIDFFVKRARKFVKELKEIQSIIKDMISALEKQDDGIAIAAPQIGISKQIFIVSGKVLRLAEPKYKGEENYITFINPEIIKFSKEKQEVEEGCLSVRWKYGKIKRAEKVSRRLYF